MAFAFFSMSGSSIPSESMAVIGSFFIVCATVCVLLPLVRPSLLFARRRASNSGSRVGIVCSIFMLHVCAYFQTVSWNESMHQFFFMR